MVTEDEMVRAYARLYGADDVYRAAERAVTAQAATVLKLELTRILDEHAGISGFRYDSEFCYDDEGGYFRTISLYPEMDQLASEEDEGEAEGALTDVQPWSIQAVEMVFDTGDEWAGSVTREKLLANEPANA